MKIPNLKIIKTIKSFSNYITGSWRYAQILPEIHERNSPAPQSNELENPDTNMVGTFFTGHNNELAPQEIHKKDSFASKSNELETPDTSMLGMFFVESAK